MTHKLSWEEPTFPEAVNLDDSGSVLLAEDDDDRVMPSRSIVQASGRYDLHAAIMASGGYRAVAKALERRPSWPPSLVSFKRFCGFALFSFFFFFNIFIVDCKLSKERIRSFW